MLYLCLLYCRWRIVHTAAWLMGLHGFVPPFMLIALGKAQGVHGTTWSVIDTADEVRVKHNQMEGPHVLN